MSDRIGCIVPHCRRTHKPFENGDTEWICSVHWPMVPRAVRAAGHKSTRDYRRAFGDTPFWKFPPGSEKRIECLRLERIAVEAWRECKRIAIEKGMGL